MCVSILKTKLGVIDSELIELKQQKADIINALRSVCHHVNIIEAPFQKMNFVDSFVPTRLCTDCGTQEDGWYFEILKIDTPTIVTRDELYSVRNKFNV